MSLFNDELELLAARSAVAEQLPGGATTCYNVWIPPNRHDEAILPLQLILAGLRAQRYPVTLLNRKLVFAKECGIIPGTFRYAVVQACTLNTSMAPLN